MVDVIGLTTAVVELDELADDGQDVLAADHPRLAGLAVVRGQLDLHLGRGLAQRRHNQPRTQLGQPRGQSPGGIGRADRYRFRAQHRTGIHSCIEEHNRNASLAVPLQNRLRNGRDATISRK